MKRRSERAIRAMQKERERERERERLFSNIYFFEKQPIENKSSGFKKTTYVAQNQLNLAQDHN